MTCLTYVEILKKLGVTSRRDPVPVPPHPDIGAMVFDRQDALTVASAPWRYMEGDWLIVKQARGCKMEVALGMLVEAKGDPMTIEIDILTLARDAAEEKWRAACSELRIAQEQLIKAREHAEEEHRRWCSAHDHAAECQKEVSHWQSVLSETEDRIGKLEVKRP